MNKNRIPAPFALLLLATVLLAAPAVAEDSPTQASPVADVFREIPFEQGLEEAAAAKKLVLVDFYTSWCAPCQKLKKTTWIDPKVVSWIEANAVAVRIDAEKEEALADRFSVSNYPTILLARADGSEIDRLVGYKGPDAFLAGIEAARKGEGGLESARLGAKARAKDPQARMKYAKALVERGHHEDALAEFLWCYDHGLEHDASFAGVRQSFLLSELNSLGREYPPAREALVERRDRFEARLRKGPGNHDVANDYAALNRTLGEASSTQAFYDFLTEQDATHAASRRALAVVLIERLMGQKRYEDIVRDIGPDQRFHSSVLSFESMARRVAGQPNKQRMLEYQRERLREEGANAFEALLGAGERERAFKTVDRVVDFDPAAQTWVWLIGRSTRLGDDEARGRLVEMALEAVPEEDREKIRKAVPLPAPK